MTYEEYLENRETLLTHLSRCKNENDAKRIMIKIAAMDNKYDYHRLHIGRPEAKLQVFGVSK